MKMPHFPVITGKNIKRCNFNDLTILLNALDNPHLNLPKIFHIAGTNGKGSSVATFSSIFSAAGYKVHSYTSPHLLEFNERIVIAGEKISDQDLWKACELVRLASIKTGIEPAFFDGITVAAFLAFAGNKADILILETGLGGRLDATNIIQTPIATLITPISYDHMDRLGNTLPLIAYEKAGIMKPNVPCVVSAQVDEVYEVLFGRANELESPIYSYDYDFGLRKAKQSFTFLSKNFTHEFSYPSLLGDHQLINIASVIATINLVKEKINVDVKAIEQGLSNIKWPGRIQKIDPKKYVNLADNNINIWIDGAHNNGGAQVLTNWMYDNLIGPTYLIIGMTKNRNIYEFCTYFKNLVEKGYGVKVRSEPLSYSAEAIVEEGNKTEIKFVAAESLKIAIQDINKSSKKRLANIMITGSLFLVADFFHMLNNDQD